MAGKAGGRALWTGSEGTVSKVGWQVGRGREGSVTTAEPNEGRGGSGIFWAREGRLLHLQLENMRELWRGHVGTPAGELGWRFQMRGVQCACSAVKPRD